MSTDARFWRNVTLIALAHIAVLVGLIRWSHQTKSSNAQSIVWISRGAWDGAAREAKSGPAPQPTKVSTLPPQPKPLKPDETEKESPVLTPAKSEIQLSTPTATTKETPKPTPKKTVLAKASPKPSPKVKPTPVKSGEKAEQSDINTDKKKIAINATDKD